MVNERPRPHKDVRLLRAALARELDTINEYEEMAEQAEDPLIRDFFYHLAVEEKEHVAEAMALIERRDPDQARESREADTRPEHFRGEAPRAASEEDATRGEGRAPASAAWTVGSLKGASE